MLIMLTHVIFTVEPVLKDHPISHKKCGLSWQVVSGDRFSNMYIEMLVLLPEMCGLSRQVVSWQWSLKTVFTVPSLSCPYIWIDWQTEDWGSGETVGERWERERYTGGEDGEATPTGGGLSDLYRDTFRINTYHETNYIFSKLTMIGYNCKVTQLLRLLNIEKSSVGTGGQWPYITPKFPKVDYYDLNCEVSYFRE